MRAAAALLLLMAAPAWASGPPAVVAAAANEWLAREAAAQPAGFADGPQIPDEWEGDDWDWVDRNDGGARGNGRKSLLKAVAASALLPGLGERYVGSGRRATFFHATEGAIWASFAGFRYQGNLRRDRYQEFALTRAGANPDEDGDYFEHIGLWLSLDEWQEIVRRDARLRFPDDPAAQQEFFEANKRYDSGQEWNWPDDPTRVRYRQLRSQSERSYRNARLSIGLAIVNRLASMVDALALGRRHNRELEGEVRLELDVSPRQTVDGLVIGPVLSARY